MLQCVGALKKLRVYQLYVRVMQRVAVCCSVLQCIAFEKTPGISIVCVGTAECCRVLPCVAVYCRVFPGICSGNTVCCSVLQCVAVCCSVLQCFSSYINCVRG